ncbi:MAG TPA: ATP-binding protein [Candidatus Angelobacter sp.]|nr:ATP-binding protein [Candidatus Angelobacter sp.]
MAANGTDNHTSSFFTNLTKEGAQVAFGKFGFEGPPGSGKTTTAALLAAGISKEFYKGAPVVWVDSENGANFIRPIFVAEGVDLLVVPTKSLATLIESVAQAKRAGACVLVPDSMTKFWTTLVANYMREHRITSYRQMLSHWPAVKDPWREWADLFINCPLHTIACGRGGFEYDQVDVIDAEGNVNTETVKGDYKMKGEGEFGHEPDVNLHFQSMTDPNAPQSLKQKKGKKGAVQLVAPRKIHVATVQKGRVWPMNGKVFQWADRDSYKSGEYKSVLDCFRPYLEALNIGGQHQTVSAGANPFGGDHATNGSYLRKKKALETWDATMRVVFPKNDTATKVARQFVGEAITGTRSKTAFAAQTVDQVEFQLLMLRKFEERAKTEGTPDISDAAGPKQTDNRGALEALIAMAREEAEYEWAALHGTPQTPTSESADGSHAEVPF